jgi:hypothetical protein
MLIKEGVAGKPVSREILSFASKAADLSGRDVVFTHQPENWKGPARDLNSALSGAITNTGRIKPVLLVGPQTVVTGMPFYYRFPPDTGVGGVGGLLGGLGTRTPVPIATMESVEFEFASPSGKREAVIREIFDRVGPARRAADKHLNADEIRRQLAIKEAATRGIFSFFFTTGRIDMAQLRGVAEEKPRKESSKKDKTINIRQLLQAVNVSFVAISDGLMGRLDKGTEGVVRFYPDSPRLQIAELNISDRRFALDLRHNHVRAVAPGAPAGTVFYGRVFRGVFEGSLETAMAEYLTTELIRKEKWGPVVSTSKLFERAHTDGVRLVLFGGDRSLPGDTIPEDARVRVKHALAGGNWVIAPERALAVSGPQRFAWWQIDSRSGETLAVTDDGLHGAPVEKPFTEVHIVGGSVAGLVAVFVYSNVGGLLLFEQAVEVLGENLADFLATLGPVVVH